jgi:hypothetical protein
MIKEKKGDVVQMVSIIDSWSIDLGSSPNVALYSIKLYYSK